MAKVSAVYALANSANYKFDICKMGEHNYDPSCVLLQAGLS